MIKVLFKLFVVARGEDFTPKERNIYFEKIF